jgi:glycosyltransferase involved in cell wall biosynthesis
MLGIKRNDLVNMAQGDYISFVDDDDKLSPDYVSELLKAIDESNGADVINFIVNVSLNGSSFKPCYYSVTHGHDFNRDESYHRLPNHITCIKRQLCLETPYKPILYGEDSAFSKELAPKIKREFNINKILYEYHYNSNTTETQQHLKHKRVR